MSGQKISETLGSMESMALERVCAAITTGEIHPSQLPVSVMAAVDKRKSGTQLPCPACKEPGWWTGESNGERKTVYWCHNAACAVRSFVTN